EEQVVGVAAHQLAEADLGGERGDLLPVAGVDQQRVAAPAVEGWDEDAGLRALGVLQKVRGEQAVERGLIREGDQEPLRVWTRRRDAPLDRAEHSGSVGRVQDGPDGVGGEAGGDLVSAMAEDYHYLVDGAAKQTAHDRLDHGTVPER